MAHRHNFRVLSYNIKTATFVCNGCKEVYSRATTAGEKIKLKARSSGVADVHKAWHKFSEEYSIPGKEEFIKEWDGEWLLDEIWSGKLQKKKLYKQYLRVVHVDNNCFENSALILFEHKSKNMYMGTSVIYIPQNQVPVEFFLYPGDREELIKALVQIRQESRLVERAEKQFRKENDINKILKWRSK